MQILLEEKLILIEQRLIGKWGNKLVIVVEERLRLTIK